MKIAVAADGFEVTSTIPSLFSSASFLLIADMDSCMICEAFEKSGDDPHNLGFAQIAADMQCESVICGQLEKAPFDLLADGCITRSLGSGLTVEDALNCECILPLITEAVPAAQAPDSIKRIN
jgi:Uncharacterized conserved protein